MATSRSPVDPEVDSILQEARRRASITKPKFKRVRVTVRHAEESIHDQWATAKPANALRLPNPKTPPPNPLDSGK